MTYDPTWIRKSPVLIPQAVHNESLTAQKGSVRLDALDWGQKVGATELDSNKGTGSGLSLAPLNNGKMFVAWSAGAEGRYVVLDSDGNMDSTAIQVFEANPNFLDYNYGIATALLPNGNIAIAYGQDQGTENALVLKIYSESGSVVRSAVTVKTHATETEWGVGLAALPDGNIVVTWNENVAGNMSYFAVYDMDGDVVKGYTSLGGDYGSPQAAPLSDGNWMVTYTNSGNVYYRTYDRLGIQIVGETLFRSSASQAAGVVTMGNGQIVVPFNGNPGFGILDRQGNVVVAPEVKEAGGGIYSISVLPHDNIVAQLSNGTSATYKIYDSEGSLLNTQVTYDTADENIDNGDVATFKNGNFMLAYVTSSGENELKVFIHQGTKAGFAGDLTVDGTFGLATGTTINEISTDNTLGGDSDDVIVTEKAVKYYVDQQIGGNAAKIFDGDSAVEVIDDSTATGVVNITIDNSLVASYGTGGLTLGGGIAVAQFNNDDEMGGYSGSAGSQTAVATEYAARKYVDDINEAQSEPTGFSDGNSDSITTLGIDGSNSIFIEPTGASYDIFFKGERWRKTTKESVTISDVEGIHYIYFDSADGVLKETTTFNINLLYSNGYVAVAYWDATNKEVIYFGDERHGCTMDGKTHVNIHTYRGTLYNSGLAVGDITADSTSATNADAQFSVANGSITDEDISHTIASQSLPANLPMFYLSGTSDWRYEAADDFPVVNTGTGRVAWNELSGGTWSLTEGTDNSYVLTHVFATNDPNKPVVGIVGQANYSTLESARIGAADEINSLITGTMPFAEFLAVATVIYETADAHGNTPKAIVVSNDEGDAWTDWRTSGLTSGVGAVNDHGNLTGLANDDHLQYYRVDGLRDITGNLTVNGTSTLQGAVTAEAGLDVSGGTLAVANGTTINEFSIDGTLVGDSDDALPTEQAVKTYVDTAITNLNPDKIWEGDSYVEVVDDGTNVGYVSIVTDGVEVGNYTEETQKMGTSNNFISVDATAGTTVVPSGSLLAMTIDDTGLTLENGTNINEFSIDGTLADDSDDAVPTEKAVKTYVDSQIGGAAHQIIAGDSYVRVVDSTGDGYVEVVVDGTQVQYWDDEATTIRMGKASAAGRVVITDTEVSGYVATDELMSLTANLQTFGLATDTYLSLNQTNDTITGICAASSVFILDSTFQQVGATASRLYIDGSTNTVSLDANSVEVLNATSTIQQLGVSADTFLNLNQTSNTVDLRANNVSVLNATDTAQRFGTSGDTALTLNTGADTFTLSAGAITQVSGSTTAITLGVAGDTTILMDSASDQVAITAGGQSQLLVETSGTTVYDDLTVTGDLFVDGTTFVVNQEHVQTSDNIITVNYGEVGAGVTAGTAGIEVDRGTLPNYEFLFFENTDTFRIGETGSTQAVATREDTPQDITVPWWNSSEYRFETAGNTAITIDTTAEVITFYANSATPANITDSGLALALGSRINEFSTDGTLVGDSDNAVPTEKAVKSYVDAQIGGASNWIFQGDSLVRVIDDGTAPGYIEVVADGVQVQYWDAEATSIRMGKASGAGRVVVTDTSVAASVGALEVLSLSATTYRLGVNNDSSFTVFDSGLTQTATLELGNTNLMFASATGQIYLGPASDRFEIDFAAHVTTVDANSVEVASFAETSQRIGVAGDSRLNIDQSADTFDLYAGSVQAISGTTNILTLGTATDTNIAINQSADTIVLESANTSVATFDPNGLTLANGTAINEFSIDGTLADDSDNALPTEKAVKTYVDTAVAGLTVNKIYQGDSYVEVLDDGTAAGNISIVADGVEVAYYDALASSQRHGKANGGRVVTADASVNAFIASTQTLALSEAVQIMGVSTDTFLRTVQSSNTITGMAGAVDVLSLTDATQTLGVTADTRVLVHQANDEVTLYAATSEVASFDTLGMQLGGSGVRVTTISNDSGMGSSATSLITQAAATTYIDTGDTNTYNAAVSYADGTTLVDANVYTDEQIAALRSEVDLINMRTITTDSTATTGDVLLVDTTAGDVDVEMIVAEDSRIIIKKKTTDGNRINISTSDGTVDGQNLIIIDTPYQSFTFVSDGSNFYII